MSNNDKRQFIFTSADDDVHFFMYVAGSAQENINERAWQYTKNSYGNMSSVLT